MPSHSPLFKAADELKTSTGKLYWNGTSLVQRHPPQWINKLEHSDPCRVQFECAVTGASICDARHHTHTLIAMASGNKLLLQAGSGDKISGWASNDLACRLRGIVSHSVSI